MKCAGGQEEAGLFGPDSLMWKINRELVVLLAGPAAAVLQVAHPQVALGVARHSRFREDAGGRLHRTLDAVYTVAFGGRGDVERMRVSVARMHAKVRGEGYSAAAPDAQLWVMATLIMGSVSMYERFVATLSMKEKNHFLLENRTFGEVFGMRPELLPAVWEDFLKYWQGMMEGGTLGSIPECGEVARAVLQPKRPAMFRVLHPVLPSLAAVLIPQDLAERLGLPAGWHANRTWAFLDRFLPRLLPLLPSRARFSGHYIRASRRLGA